MEDVEIVENGEGEGGDVFAAYYADGGKQNIDRQPVFCEELGLAVEQLRPGFTIDNLWNVLN
eukprot:SAG31_NODE_30025_length_386_cov_1.059233_1_plen_62_part_00